METQRPIARLHTRAELSPRSAKNLRWLGLVLAMIFVFLALSLVGGTRFGRTKAHSTACVLPVVTSGPLPLGQGFSDCAPACDHAEGLFRQQKMQSIPARERAEGLFSRVFKRSHGPRTVSAVGCRLRSNSKPHTIFHFAGPQNRFFRQSNPNFCFGFRVLDNGSLLLDRADQVWNPVVSIRDAYGGLRTSREGCRCRATGVYVPPRFRRDHKTHDVACWCSASSLYGPELESLRDRYLTFHGGMDTHPMTGQVCRAQCISSKEAQRFRASIGGREVRSIHRLPSEGVRMREESVCQQAGGLSISPLVCSFAPGIWSLSFRYDISSYLGLHESAHKWPSTLMETRTNIPIARRLQKKSFFAGAAQWQHGRFIVFEF